MKPRTEVLLDYITVAIVAAALLVGALAYFDVLVR
jgi:hypothetical protein